MARKLEGRDLNRRLHAGRILAGHPNQKAFTAWVREKYGVENYGDIERADKDLQFNDRVGLQAAFGLPEYWFTAPPAELFAEAEKVQQLLGVVYAMLEAFVPEEEAARLYERLVQEVFGDEPGTGESDSSATS